VAGHGGSGGGQKQDDADSEAAHELASAGPVGRRGHRSPSPPR